MLEIRLHPSKLKNTFRFRLSQYEVEGSISKSEAFVVNQIQKQNFLSKFRVKDQLKQMLEIRLYPSKLKNTFRFRLSQYEVQGSISKSEAFVVNQIQKQNFLSRFRVTDQLKQMLEICFISKHSKYSKCRFRLSQYEIQGSICEMRF